jgi:hypothetical protein
MRFLIGILFLVAFIGAYAQPPKKFYCRYGGNGYDEGNDVKQTLDGGYIITGSTSSIGQGNTDMYLLKLDSMGQVKFQKTFGGVSNEIGKSIVQLADSNYVMAGYTSSSGVGGYDVFLVKADKAGNLIWQKTYGGSDWDFANSMDTITGGGFIIAGTTYSYGKGNADGFVIKTDANGDTAWTKTFGGLKDDEFKSVIQTSDGNYALTGYTKSFNDSLGDVWALKLDVNGDTLWRKFYGGNKSDNGNQIIEHPTGDLYIAGGSRSFGTGQLDGYLLRLNNNGTQLLFQIDNTSSSYQEFNSIAISKRSNNFVNAIAKETVSGFNAQSKMLEMNLGLSYINAIDFGSTLEDETRKIIATRDKGYVCIGYTYGYNSILSDCYFVKVDSNLQGAFYSIVSVYEAQAENIQIIAYPNPTSNELNLKLNSKTYIDKLKLYNLSGQEISLSDRIISNQYDKITLNLEDLESGIYFLKYLDRVIKVSLFH